MAEGKRCALEGPGCDYTEPMWQCRTCHEWFCTSHWHVTSLGYCVECVTCERKRESRAKKK